MPSLNEDVLALIIAEAAREAEATAPPAEYTRRLDIQFTLRAETLRRLSLVSHLFRQLAQAELGRFVLLYPVQYQIILDAPKLQLSTTRRILIRSHGFGFRDHGQSMEVLERCEGVEEVTLSYTRASLSSLARPTHRNIRSLTLRHLVLSGADPTIEPHFHLETLRLDNVHFEGGEDLRILTAAGKGTLKHLHVDTKLMYWMGTEVAMAAWMPSLISFTLVSALDISTIITGSTCRTIPFSLAVNLVTLSITLEHLPGALAALASSTEAKGLSHLIVTVEGQERTIDDAAYLDLLNRLGRHPIEHLKTFVHPRGHREEDSVPFYEVVSALRMRGVEVAAEVGRDCPVDGTPGPCYPLAPCEGCKTRYLRASVAAGVRWNDTAEVAEARMTQFLSSPQ